MDTDPEPTAARGRPSTRVSDPLCHILERQDVIILDGGLATELEAKGCSLDSDLWSARVLLEQPEVVRRVHLDYLEAGADCIVSASYQATVEGFVKLGLGTDEAIEVLRRSVELAVMARDEFWARPENRAERMRPLVAASVGPYGAFLADGSEFRGDYDLDENGLVEFHRRRWQILASSGADLLACETIPARSEARAFRRLLEEDATTPAWLSFSCRDGEHVSDGSKLEAVVREIESCSYVIAVGVNCTAPCHISSLIEQVRGATCKPIVVYPNSGEGWDASIKRWTPVGVETAPLDELCTHWRRLGARLIGGCCRTGPAEIERMRKRLLE